MKSISPYLNFNGTTEEAFNFYRSVFGGDFSAKTRYRDMPDGDKLPANEKDRIMHMALPLKNGALYGSDSLDSRGPRVTAGNSVYIMIAPESEEEARNIFEALSAGGEIFRQGVAEELAGLERIVLICGRYEGVDERVAEHLADRELSVGDFVLSGGELGAAIVQDAVTRLIPGALGNQASSQQESFSSSRSDGRLARQDNEPDSTCGSGGLPDYPHYTRPADFRG
jgi:uncharacterized glyoxalase superfamily protein PhnB